MSSQSPNSRSPEPEPEDRKKSKPEVPRIRTDSDTVPPLRNARTTFRSPRRSTTSQQYNPNTARGRRWKPGLEPGIDPNSVHPAIIPHLHVDCEITLVEFSPDNLEVFIYDNNNLTDLMHDLANTKPTSCKWINVNGLSWDVISALAKAKKIHPLAIEDVLSKKNRTKADWYADHAYIVLPLQKLIHLSEGTKSQEEEDLANSSFTDVLGSIFRRRAKGRKNEAERAGEIEEQIESYAQSTSLGQLKRQETNVVKTLQRFHGGVNQERIEFMEKHSALQPKGLGVSVEQVSIFLMADNTVVSFFDHSAQDIEMPILTRLNSEDTVLRRSADASMIVQAILDGIIDLALPVATAYHDAIDELELNVLTAPEVHHTRSLYVLQSEVAQLRSTIAPASGLVDALRDHASHAPHAPALLDPNNGAVNYASPRNVGGSASTVTISPLAKTYLADVADHVSVVRDDFDQMRRASDNMTDLIFNTVSAIQNESMRQLTVVTILFLPMTFITGYFGMNFVAFDGVMLHSDLFFWEIAIPVGFVVFVWVMRDMIWRWFNSRRLRLGIMTSRRRREKLEDRKVQ